jgi:hypothetical protein
VSGDRSLAIDQLLVTVASLSDSWQREAATATFFEEHALPVVEDDIATFAVGPKPTPSSCAIASTSGLMILN